MRSRQASIGATVLMVLSAVSVVLVQQRPAGAAAGPQLVTNRSFLFVSAFDGFGTSGETDELESVDEPLFSESIEAHDPPGGEGTGDALADQTASIDTSDPDVLRADIAGGATAQWADFVVGDAEVPEGEGRSEFFIRFEVTEPTAFSVTGTATAVTSDTNAACSFVSVFPPDSFFADGFDAPNGCVPGLNETEFTRGGVLEPGTHTLLIEAFAVARNPDAAGGSANVTFEAALTVGCTNEFTPGNDPITGTAGDDLLCGGGGGDTISGLGGADVIVGGDGGDTIEGGGDNDRLIGDDPTDAAAAGIDTVNGGPGDDTIFGGPSGDTLDGGGDADRVFGDAGIDTISGGAQKDVLVGGSAGDTIDGQGGDDEVDGQEGIDTITGGAGDDLLEGGTERDIIRGQAGSDKLRGQGGPDHLVGGLRKDVLIGAGGADTLIANDGVRDEVRGGPSNNDKAKVDSRDDVTGVEVFL